MNDEENSVVFDDTVSRIVLTPAGPAGLGFPTKVSIKSGPFVATIKAEAQNYESFRSDLARLHETLSGSASLHFWDEEHEVTVKGNGRGDIEVLVKVTDSRTPWHACLRIELALDQSYLPDIIEAIRQNFLR